jgi:hypothetical protein
MSTRALIRAIQHLLSQPSRLAQRITKKIVTGFMRNLLLLGRRPRLSKAGFVLPTTVLLLLVVTLTVGSITYRTYTRTAQTIGDRQQRVIYNAATPAIDRARAKLEYLFDAKKDPRFPGGIPGEGRLYGMLLNDGILVQPHLPNGVDPYTLPDEERIDLNGGGVDNAWRYRVDTDEDGQPDATVAYSILFQTPVTSRIPAQNETPPLTDSSEAAIRERARKQQVRQGPLSSITPRNNACRSSTGANLPEAGWIPDTGSSTSTLRKNFQIDAFVLPDAPTGTVTTLEFYQDRQVERGNKWGAWFRNDLEIFPGPDFNWNGAMHTEGSLIVGKPDRGLYSSYMISSHNSCLYTKTASEITVAEIREDVDSNNDGEIDIPRFRGQIISGLTGRNNFSGDSRFHLFTADATVPINNPNNNDTRLDNSKDSVPNNTGSIDYALDPVKLFTEGVSISRGGDVFSFRGQEANWQASLLSKERIRNQSEDAPSVDDSFRADNRYGPKPRYQNRKLPPTVTTIGQEITGDLMASLELPDSVLVNDNPAVATDNTTVGLDGYWERRARLEGLRLIVGQRLELGNPFPKTWDDYDGTGLPRSPLRPWEPPTGESCEIAAGDTLCNEARQRRTLRDNLAAVQAMAVYHSANSADSPIACLATTAHPGTAISLDRSTTFENITAGTTLTGLTVSDFFSGRGTNGWEYEPPTPTAFSNSDWINALQNLAHFAGDPNGGAPSFPPVQDGTVHPYPIMSMWGDFSVLRRVMGSAGSTFNYANVTSPADKATLDTAACTLGMLAHNIQYLESLSYTDPNIAILSDMLNQLTNGGFGTTDIVRVGLGLQPEAYIEGLKRARFASLADRPTLETIAIPLAQLVMQKEQVERDRQGGFDTPTANTCQDATDAGLELLCPQDARYPILYSLFPPTVDEEHTETGFPLREPADRTDPYITNPSINGTYTYKTVDISQIALAPREISNWRTPTQRDGSDITANSNRKVLIKVCGGNGRSLCPRSATGEFNTGDLYQVAFKDSAVFNGREMMSVRTLDINLDLLRRSGIGGNFWLPESGIVYAFREDAVSENSIVRPRSATWTGACTSNAGYDRANGGCHMRVGKTSAVSSLDPPLNPIGISPKPVDYYPDPDRRPHGFRLRQGEKLFRGNSASRAGDQGRGLSFVTDNPAYIQGDFNLHRSTNGVLLEEFEQTLFPVGATAAYTPAQFYNNRVTPDTRFADLANDEWRPTEILADAITILSANFCDGSIEDGFLTVGLATPTGGNLSTRLREEQPGSSIIPSLVPDGSVYRCYEGVSPGTLVSNPKTSYLNQNRPDRDPGRAGSNSLALGGSTASMAVNNQRWARENWYDRGSPVAVSRNGNPLKIASRQNDEYSKYQANESYYRSDVSPTQRPRIDALPGTRVNSIIISGIVPSRQDQSYGGMHNFPRLLETWGRTNPLFISGSFLQLNFSNYATGPYDQDAFEVGSNPLSDANIVGGVNQGELIRYYDAPARFWGYDVGLQYAPAGPLAQRFVTFTSIRSEFYSEPPADDPYILRLCNALPNPRCVAAP